MSCFCELVVESDSSNASAQATSSSTDPWKFHFFFNEIKNLSSSMRVEFKNILRLADGLVDLLTKDGVDHLALLFDVFM